MTTKRGRELEEAVCKEAKRLGLTCEIERTKGDHRRALLSFGDQRGAVTFGGTPSDKKAILATVSWVRRYARSWGAGRHTGHGVVRS